MVLLLGSYHTELAREAEGVLEGGREGGGERGEKISEREERKKEEREGGREGGRTTYLKDIVGDHVQLLLLLALDVNPALEAGQVVDAGAANQVGDGLAGHLRGREGGREGGMRVEEGKRRHL